MEPGFRKECQSSLRNRRYVASEQSLKLLLVVIGFVSCGYSQDCARENVEQGLDHGDQFRPEEQE